MTVKKKVVRPKAAHTKPKTPEKLDDTAGINEKREESVPSENEHPHGLGENPTYKSVVPRSPAERAEEEENYEGTDEKELLVGENPFVPESSCTIFAEHPNETTVVFDEITVTPLHGINDTPYPTSDFNEYFMV